MQFERYVDLKDVTSLKEYQEKLNDMFSLGEVSTSRLKELAKELCGVDSLPKLSRAERARRRSASQQLRDKMTAWLTDNYASKERRDESILDEITDRLFTKDSILQLPHPEQDAKFAERANTLRTGTREEKTNLFFEVLHEAKEGYTREKLMNLTDEEIAADFDRLHLLQDIANNALDFLGNSNLQLSPEQRQELIDLDRELSTPLTTVFARAKLIASPYYEHVALEQLPFQDPMALSNRETELGFGLTDDKEEFLVKLMKEDLNAFNTYGIRNGWLNDIQKRELGGVQSEDVAWLGQDGSSLGEHLSQPPVDEMTEGRSIIACMPDNTEKVFVPERRNGILAMQTYSLSAYLDKTTGEALPKLADGLKEADHWYVKSSQEFKDVRSAMEKVQKELKALGPDPNEDQRNELATHMRDLMSAASAYTTYKTKQKPVEEMNNLEKERMAAVSAVQDFAKKQMTLLHVLSSNAAVREAAREAARENPAEKEIFQKVQPQEARAAWNQGQTIDQVIDQYQSMKIPSSSAGDELQKHANLTSMSLRNVAVLADNEKSAKGRLCDQPSCCEALADMVITDLCLKERVDTVFQKEGDPAGAFETTLNMKNIKRGEGTVNGVDLLRERVMAAPAFKELTETLDIKGVRDFIAGRRVQSVSQKILPQMFPPQNSAGKTAPLVNQMQNTTENTRQNNTLKVK